jgi:hypothetical protein
MPIKKTTFGPLVVKLRGAGSLGHDPQTIGSGADIGLDIQVPTTQTANVFQITKPDGTVIYAIGPGGALASTGAPVAITASGAVAFPGTYIITAGSAVALTLAAPVAGTDDGKIVQITSATLFAHTLTATGLLQTGTASVNVATFAAFAGAGLTLRAFNAKWQVMSSTGITFS